MIDRVTDNVSELEILRWSQKAKRGILHKEGIQDVTVLHSARRTDWSIDDICESRRATFNLTIRELCDSFELKGVNDIYNEAKSQTGCVLNRDKARHIESHGSINALLNV